MPTSPTNSMSDAIREAQDRIDTIVTQCDNIARAWLTLSPRSADRAIKYLEESVVAMHDAVTAYHELRTLRRPNAKSPRASRLRAAISQAAEEAVYCANIVVRMAEQGDA